MTLVQTNIKTYHQLKVEGVTLLRCLSAFVATLRLCKEHEVLTKWIQSISYGTVFLLGVQTVLAGGLFHIDSCDVKYFVFGTVAVTIYL